MKPEPGTIVLTDPETGRIYWLPRDHPRVSVQMNELELLQVAKDLENERSPDLNWKSRYE